MTTASPIKVGTARAIERAVLDYVKIVNALWQWA